MPSFIDTPAIILIAFIFVLGIANSSCQRQIFLVCLV